MFTNPSTDALLEGLIMAIDDDILPALGTSPKAQATAVMMQSVIQGIRQALPVQDTQLVEEHNAMTAVLREVAAALGEVDGDAVDRVRERAATLGQRDDLPAPPDRDPMVAAHAELSASLADTMIDLDELQRGGVASADGALQLVRAHLGPRYLRDVATITVGSGFVGRG
jgi:hypothetical protein